MSQLRGLATGLRFAAALPGFLRLRMDHAAALVEVQRRLRARPAAFLDIMRDAVYPHAQHPARRLLAHAGCEPGDLAALVQREGLEGALAALCARGVWLSGDELAGRVPVRRGSMEFTVTAEGGRGATPGELILDLDGLRDHLPNRRLGYDADGAAEAVTALWLVPGSAALLRMLAGAVTLGRAPAAWFSPVALDAVAPRYRLSHGTLRGLGRALGWRFPPPRHVPLDDPRPIADWLRGVLRAGARPHLACAPAAAVRLCEVALSEGIDIAGSGMLLRGEPVTAARMRAVAAAGVRVSTLYGTAEAAIVGHGCQCPAVADEVHVFSDLLALVTAGAGHPALPADALLATSLRRGARLLLLNTALGDRGVLGARACGCPLEAWGLTTHLHGIRSFTKLTGAGMTFTESELLPILTDTLPRRFGGDAGDYQLEEGESDAGRAEVRLVVHPRLGPLDEAALVDAFLDALAELSEVRRVMSLTWRGAGIVGVVRRVPAVGPAGRIVHALEGAATPRRI